jgi:tyrosine-protein kinase Etk/Wzc
MSTPESINQPPPPAEDNGETNLLELLIVLAKNKRMILSVTFGAAALSTIVSLLLPNIYTATAKVLPPQQSQSSAAMLLGQLGGLAGLVGGSAVGIKNPNDLYVGMLKSRTVADNIIGRFDFQKVYDEDTMVETRKEFARNSAITAGKDGLITIAFDDENPERAAAAANAYVDELDKLTQSIAVTEAAQRRLFFERQLQQAKKDLGDAEVALKLTQEKTGLIMLDSQGRAIIEAVATLRGQIAAKEVELQAMRTFATEKNSEYVRTRQQLAALQSELTKLERAQISGGGDVLLPTGKVPEAGLEYLRKLRDVKYSETVFELLAKQFEIAKLDEVRDAGLVQVLDRAITPDKKSKPHRALIVLFATLVAAVVGVVWAMLREERERTNADPVRAARFAALLGYTSFRRRQRD